MGNFAVGYFRKLLGPVLDNMYPTSTYVYVCMFMKIRTDVWTDGQLYLWRYFASKKLYNPYSTEPHVFFCINIMRIQKNRKVRYLISNGYSAVHTDKVFCRVVSFLANCFILFQSRLNSLWRNMRWDFMKWKSLKKKVRKKPRPRTRPIPCLLYLDTYIQDSILCIS